MSKKNEIISLLYIVLKHFYTHIVLQQNCAKFTLHSSVWWSEIANFNVLGWPSLNISIVFNLKLYEIQNTVLSLIIFNKNNEEQHIGYSYSGVQKKQNKIGRKKILKKT